MKATAAFLLLATIVGCVGEDPAAKKNAATNCVRVGIDLVCEVVLSDGTRCAVVPGIGGIDCNWKERP